MDLKSSEQIAVNGNEHLKPGPVLGGKKYVRPAVNGQDWPPNDYYKYHWNELLVHEDASEICKLSEMMGGDNEEARVC